MFCSTCGTQLPDNSKFCDNCGLAINIPTPPIAVVQQSLCVSPSHQTHLGSESPRSHIVNRPASTVQNSKWQIIASVLAICSAFLYIIIQITSYGRGYLFSQAFSKLPLRFAISACRNPIFIAATVILAVLSVLVERKKAFLTAIPVALFALLHFSLFLTWNYSLNAFMYFLICAVVFIVYILTVLDKISNKRVAVALISLMTGLYFFTKIVDVSKQSNLSLFFTDMFATLLFWGCYIALTFAIMPMNRTSLPSIQNQYDKNSQTHIGQSAPSAVSLSEDFFSLGAYIIDEKISALKFTNSYKIFNTTGQQIGMVEQQKVSGSAKAARILIGNNIKTMQSFKLDIKDISGSVLVSIQRGGVGSEGGIRNVNILSSNGQPIGSIKILFGLFTPKLEIKNSTGQVTGYIQGDWKGWNFSITDTLGNIIGTINKKWAGAIREVFTTSDKYFVSINPNMVEDCNQIMIAAAITLDMLLNEYK